MPRPKTTKTPGLKERCETFAKCFLEGSIIYLLVNFAEYVDKNLGLAWTLMTLPYLSTIPFKVYGSIAGTLVPLSQTPSLFTIYSVISRFAHAFPFAGKVLS
jgi:hypothetical protein